MPPIHYLSGMASHFGMTTDQLINALKAIGILKTNGFPKQKFIDEGFFDEEGNIANFLRLKELIKIMLGI